MQKTYKCKKGHKFKREEATDVLCPTCNESAEPVKWKTVDQFDSNKNDTGVMGELGSVAGQIPGASTAVKILGIAKVASLFK